VPFEAAPNHRRGLRASAGESNGCQRPRSARVRPPEPHRIRPDPEPSRAPPALLPRRTNTSNAGPGGLQRIQRDLASPCSSRIHDARGRIRTSDTRLRKPLLQLRGSRRGGETEKNGASGLGRCVEPHGQFFARVKMRADGVTCDLAPAVVIEHHSTRRRQRRGATYEALRCPPLRSRAATCAATSALRGVYPDFVRLHETRRHDL
jgi:hypothetical protein